MTEAIDDVLNALEKAEASVIHGVLVSDEMVTKAITAFYRNSTLSGLGPLRKIFREVIEAVAQDIYQAGYKAGHERAAESFPNRQGRPTDD